MDAKVIHVDLQPFFPDHIGEDMIHECLECGWCVTKSEEHDGGFEEPHGGDESCFPLVFLPNANVVVSPADVELGEQGRLFHIIDQFWDKRKRVGIPDSVGV